MQTKKKTVDLPFSGKYDTAKAKSYQAKHQSGLMPRLSSWREVQIARKALKIAGQPEVVLDLPCGAGRFWPMLKENKNRVVIAADNSEAMLEVAKAANPWYEEQNIRCLQTSVFDIKLPDSSVDSVFCMRLLHHVEFSQDRNVMLEELHRVTRDTVIVSLWVDGNYKSWRRSKREKRMDKKNKRTSHDRFVIPVIIIEQEFAKAGFEIIAHTDHLPFYSMWRIYVLRKC